jgi:hypothetical protein
MIRVNAVPLALAAVLALSPALALGDEPPQDKLVQEITRLDHDFFDSFNRCADPAQLASHANWLDPNLEFYHDQGGVTWTADAYLQGVKNNVCGKFARELVPGSMKVSPIKDFGAFSTGTHRFCHFDTGRCEGEADFAILWRQGDDGRWTITRVVSYAHRAAPGRPLPLPTTPMPAPTPTPAKN